MTIPAHALYFGGYEISKKYLQPTTSIDEKSPWVHFLSGIFADICGSVLWVPMDVVKQRMQLGKNSIYSGMVTYKAFMTILEQEGLIGLYRGAPVAIATFGPYVAIYFTLYEHFKYQISKEAKNSDKDYSIGLFHTLLCAFAGSSISAIVTCPIDVIKTNIQVTSRHQKGFVSTIDVVKQLYRSGGFKAFIRGLSARVMWLAPGTSITIAAFEQVKRILYHFEESN